MELFPLDICWTFTTGTYHLYILSMIRVILLDNFLLTNDDLLVLISDFNLSSRGKSLQLTCNVAGIPRSLISGSTICLSPDGHTVRSRSDCQLNGSS